MRWRTHALLGATSLWLMAPIPGALTSDTIGPLCALAAFAALLPDLDAEASKIKSLSVLNIRPFVPFANRAYHAWGHRGLLHSLLFLCWLGGVCVLFGLLWNGPAMLALWLGYASHLAGDACTKSGIPGWPNRPHQRLYLLPARWRFTTGSDSEEALVPLLAVAVLFLLLLYYPTG